MRLHTFGGLNDDRVAFGDKDTKQRGAAIADDAPICSVGERKGRS
jgi:hypothetical protein